ncbi:MAG: Gfo/Idh/MocA family oxidoreductase, partial [Eubacteriales bacterium]|nr:Gfo/Idh/MocA family oxidoreductase [Eubacteriales bacterium]
LIGAGVMGRTHSNAYKSVNNIFGDEVVPELTAVADINADNAKALAERYGFQRWTTEWKEIVADPEIELVDITTPNASHCPIAMEAARHGKHVYCEKPLAMTAAEAVEANRVVEEAGVVSSVGFNYVRNPIQQYVRELIASGELGEAVNFRGMYDQDYYNDPEQKHEWRMFKSASASGALGDLASHTLSLSQYLVGDIAEVCGMTKIVVPERPDPKDPSKLLPVENDDVVQFLFNFQNGACGAIFSNRLAAGRKMSLGYEIQMTNGCIVYNQENQNQVQIYRHDDDKRERGFKTVLIAPGHGEYERFFGGAGICLGYADQKTIEVYHTLKCIVENRPCEIDFRFGMKVMQVIDAVLESAETRQWVAIR